jgi:hypothetical protein
MALHFPRLKNLQKKKLPNIKKLSKSHDLLTLVKSHSEYFAAKENEITHKPISEVIREISLGLKLEDIEFKSIQDQTIVLVPPKYEFWVYMLMGLFLAMRGNKVVFLYYNWSKKLIETMKSNLSYLKYQNLIFQDIENDNKFWPEDSLILNFSDDYKKGEKIPSFSTAVIADNADLDYIMGYLLSNSFSFTGMKTSNLKRVFVPKSFQVEFEQKLGIRSDSMLQVSETRIRSKKILDNIHELVSEAISDGAELMLGTPGLEKDYYENIILSNVNKDMRIYQKKFFGPILLICYIDFETEEFYDFLKQQPSKGILVFGDTLKLRDEFSEKYHFVYRPLQTFPKYNAILENNPGLELIFNKLEIK